MFSQKNNSILGIIAEYNPFHKGHAYQIERAKEITGAKYSVVVLSGDFTQRGTPALFDKYIRTRMALLGGADLVIELPLVFATSSAEGFARGGVSILNSLNCIDYLCFGSESGCLEDIKAMSDILSNPPIEAENSIKRLVREGFSYPQARETAYEELGINTDIFHGSNNVLACEYLKALTYFNSSMEPITILRNDNGYNNENIDTSFTYASASSIRNAFLNNDAAYMEYVPANIADIMKNSPHCILNDFSDLLYLRLLELKETGFTEFLDVNEEFSAKIIKHIKDYTDIDSFIAILKSKNMTYTRICRCLIHILLGIKKEDACLNPSYARILGFKKDSGELTGILKENSEIELISKMSDASECRLLDLDVKAASLYSQVNKSRINEYRMSPIII